MSTATDTATPGSSDAATRTTQVYRVYIKATPQKIWDTITSSDFNGQYGYHAAATYDLKPGGRYECPPTPEMRAMGMEQDLVVDGEVLEVDPPNRLVQTWRFRFEPEQEAEGFTTVTWEIVAESDKLSRLTVTHDVTDAPICAAQIGISEVPLAQGGGGWTWILQDLRSFIETGSGMEL